VGLAGAGLEKVSVLAEMLFGVDLRNAVA